MVRISIDVHGVITERPEFFAHLTQKLVRQHNAVFILTGQAAGIALVRELAMYNILFHHILSITTYHRTIGTPIRYKNGDPTQPKMPYGVWSPTKARLCDLYDIDLHIDDSDVYGDYFTGHTIYINIKEFDSMSSFYDVVKEKLNALRKNQKRFNQLGI
jgi:hypothetical protein